MRLIDCHFDNASESAITFGDLLPHTNTNTNTSEISDLIIII
jgi:hypothetical protein